MKHICCFLVELFVCIFIKKVYFKHTGALSLKNYLVVPSISDSNWSPI
jgi:hypothetical protein